MYGYTVRENGHTGFVDPLQGVKRICVIGAGAGGLAALKIIMDTSEYKTGLWKPTAYEKREQVGGVWYVPSILIDHRAYMYTLHALGRPTCMICVKGFPHRRRTTRL